MDEPNSHRDALKRHLLATPCRGHMRTEAVMPVTPGTPSRYLIVPSKPATAPHPQPEMREKPAPPCSERQHTRGSSELTPKNRKTEENTEESEETIKIKARVAGALGTHRAFLRQMTREKRDLEKSLEATKKEWAKLNESLGIGLLSDMPVPVALKSYISTKSWRAAQIPVEAPTRPINFILSYKRVLSSAQSTRKRRVQDVSWRAKISESPSKRQKSEQSMLDPSTVSATEYINWFRKRSRSLSRGTNLVHDEQSLCGSAKKVYDRMLARGSLTPIVTTGRQTNEVQN